jgi:Holliday junction DNA helicase RuvB
MRPKNFKDIVGQKQCKMVLETLVKYAKDKNDSVPSFLLSGPAGYGKTSIANVVANEIGSQLFTINCAGVKPKIIFNTIEEMSEKNILLLDEVHALSNKTCESLYNIIEDFCYFEQGYRIDIPKITIIGASTSIGSIPIPLKSRFKFIAYLEEYTEDELVDVCHGICEEKGFKLNKSLAKIIAKTTRGSPREIVSRTEWIYNFMVGNGLKSVNADKLKEIISFQGINENGLEKHDLDYLKTLYKNRSGLSLNALSSKLQTDVDNIKNIIEPHLIKLGFIEITTGKGRSLTRSGKTYIEKLT